MKKLLSLLALCPLALTSCKSETNNTTTIYILGHGFLINENNGDKATQNNLYNIIESSAHINKDGNIKYSIKESTKFVDIDAEETKVTLPLSAKAVTQWTPVDLTTFIPSEEYMDTYLNTITYPFSLIVNGNDGQATKIYNSKNEFKNNIEEYYKAYKKLSTEEKNGLVDGSNVGTVSKNNQALNYWYVYTDFKAHNSGTTFVDARNNWLQTFPKKDINNNGTSEPVTNIGQSLQYVYDIVEINSSYKNKLTDTHEDNLEFIAKTNDNYGLGLFQIVDVFDKIVAYANTTYMTCELVNNVTNTTIRNIIRREQGITDIVAGASADVGGLYLASLIATGKKACL